MNTATGICDRFTTSISASEVPRLGCNRMGLVGEIPPLSVVVAERVPQPGRELGNPVDR
jgi:hypothetical protein